MSFSPCPSLSFCSSSNQTQVLSILGKHSTVELYPQLLFYSAFWECFSTVCRLTLNSYCTLGRLVVLLPQPPELPGLQVFAIRSSSVLVLSESSRRETSSSQGRDSHGSSICVWVLYLLKSFIFPLLISGLIFSWVFGLETTWCYSVNSHE